MPYTNCIFFCLWIFQKFHLYYSDLIWKTFIIFQFSANWILWKFWLVPICKFGGLRWRSGKMKITGRMREFFLSSVTGKGRMSMALIQIFCSTLFGFTQNNNQYFKNWTSASFNFKSSFIPSLPLSASLPVY